MKNAFLFTALAFATLGTLTSCSGRDDEPTVQPEKQDFTNANFIKQTLQGEWKGIASSSNGVSWTTLEGPYNVGYKTTYKFSGNNFTYRPFVQDQFATEYPGTYTIIPVTGNNNAVLMMDYATFYTDKPITLLNYEDNVVTFVEPDNNYPEGVRYYKFKKQ